MQGRHVGVDRLVVRPKRLGGLAPFAEGDELTLAGPEVVPGHERLGRPVAGGQVGGRQRHDQPEVPAPHRGMRLDERHGANRFADPHASPPADVEPASQARGPCMPFGLRSPLCVEPGQLRDRVRQRVGGCVPSACVMLNALCSRSRRGGRRGRRAMSPVGWLPDRRPAARAAAAGKLAGSTTSRLALHSSGRRREGRRIAGRHRPQRGRAVGQDRRQAGWPVSSTPRAASREACRARAATTSARPLAGSCAAARHGPGDRQPPGPTHRRQHSAWATRNGTPGRRPPVAAGRRPRRSRCPCRGHARGPTA